MDQHDMPRNFGRKPRTPRKVGPKQIRIQWERCEHEGGVFTDHCGVCAPFWERYPVAVDSADVGRKVWIVDERSSGEAWEIFAFTSAQGASAYQRADMSPPYVDRLRIVGPVKLRVPSVRPCWNCGEDIEAQARKGIRHLPGDLAFGRGCTYQRGDK